MKKLDFNDIKLCQFQAKLFEESIYKTKVSSLIFIRRFMYSDLALKFDNKSFITLSLDTSDCFTELELQFGQSSYGKIKYSRNQMYWIGYVYRAISIIYDLSSKRVFKLLNAKDIVKYYDVYHTFDIEQAAERILENIGYKKKDFTLEGVKILKRLILKEELEKMLGEKVVITFDKESYNIDNKIYYGRIKNNEINNCKNIDAYIFGLNSYVNTYEGIVYAVSERRIDKKNSLVIIADDLYYSNDEIKEKLSISDHNIKYKIIDNK